MLFLNMVCLVVAPASTFPVIWNLQSFSGAYFMGYPWTRKILGPKRFARAHHTLPLYSLRAATPETALQPATPFT
jgi:hypothetical protein